jgi:hypothetical protein
MRLRYRNPWPAGHCAPCDSQVIRVRGSADALSRFSVPLLPNTLEQDHRWVKRLVNLGLGFGTFHTAQ